MDYQLQVVTLSVSDVEKAAGLVEGAFTRVAGEGLDPV